MVLVCYTSTSPTSVDIEVDYLGVVLEVMLLPQRQGTFGATEEDAEDLRQQRRVQEQHRFTPGKLRCLVAGPRGGKRSESVRGHFPDQHSV